MNETTNINAVSEFLTVSTQRRTIVFPYEHHR